MHHFLLKRRRSDRSMLYTGVSIRRVIATVMLARSTFHYRPRQKNDQVLIGRMREITLARVRYGYWRIYTLLRREGWVAGHRIDRIEASRPHQSLSMDFVADQLFDGRWLQALTVVDNFRTG